MLKEYIKANLNGAMANQHYPLFVNYNELSFICSVLEKEMKYLEERSEQCEEEYERGISVHDLSTSAQALLKAINSSYEAQSACSNYLKLYCHGFIFDPYDDMEPF